MLHPLETDAEDGDEHVDVELDNNGQDDTDVGEDGNIEADADASSEGEDGANERTNDLTARWISPVVQLMTVKKTYPREHSRGVMQPMTAEPATLKTTPRASKTSFKQSMSVRPDI